MGMCVHVGRAPPYGFFRPFCSIPLALLASVLLGVRFYFTREWDHVDDGCKTLVRIYIVFCTDNCTWPLVKGASACVYTHKFTFHFLYSPLSLCIIFLFLSLYFHLFLFLRQLTTTLVPHILLYFFLLKISRAQIIAPECVNFNHHFFFFLN